MILYFVYLFFPSSKWSLSFIHQMTFLYILYILFRPFCLNDSQVCLLSLPHLNLVFPIPVCIALPGCSGLNKIPLLYETCFSGHPYFCWFHSKLKPILVLSHLVYHSTSVDSTFIVLSIRFLCLCYGSF